MATSTGFSFFPQTEFLEQRLRSKVVYARVGSDFVATKNRGNQRKQVLRSLKGVTLPPERFGNGVAKRRGEMLPVPKLMVKVVEV